MSKSKSERNKNSHASNRATPPTAWDRAPWVDGSGQWIPAVYIEGADSNRELVFDLEHCEFRWQPVTGSLVNGAEEQGDGLYARHVELPVGASPHDRVWSSPLCHELSRVLFDGSEVLCGANGCVAVWCSDEALDALRRLTSAAVRWIAARDAGLVRTGLTDSTVEAFKEAVLRSGQQGEEAWARMEAERDLKTGAFPWLQVESVRIA